MFVAELINDPVVDRLEDNVGQVKDIVVDLSECFPKVTGILVKLHSGEEKILLISEVDLVGRQFIAAKVTADRIAWAAPRQTDILLMRDIVDQQIVDLDGARVIRVNDLKLAKVDQDIRLIAADVGAKGMLRRLGLDKFIGFFYGLVKKDIPEKLIGWDHVQNLSRQGDVCVSSKKLADLHPADVAQVISQVKSEDKTAIFSTLTEKAAADALHELEPMLGALLIANIDIKKSVAILDKMPVDEVVDILGDLPSEKTQDLLRLMKVRRAEQIQKLLTHNDETAGGLMTTEFMTLSKDLTVEQVIQKLRESAPDAETVYYLYVTDEQERLVGVLSLRSLIISPPEKKIADIMIKDPITILPAMNQRDVASVMSKYNLLAVPVVDADRKLLGIITVDDVMDFIMPPTSRRKRQMLG